MSAALSESFASAAPVELVVDGVPHRGWRNMKATLSLDAPAAKFTLDLAERWSEAEDGAARGVRPGAACELRLDGEVVVAGWIDAVDARYDERDHLLTVVARDRVGDLVDCAAVVDGPHEWAGLRLPEIARRLAEPYGVRVVTEAEAGAPFPRFAIQPGETAWEALERAARARGVLLAGDGTGTLRLTRTSLARPGAGDVELGANVRRARGVFDHSGRHSEVVVRGQAEGGGSAEGLYRVDPAAPGGAVALDGGGGTRAARTESRATDPVIARRRPRVIVAETAGEGPRFVDRARWEVRNAAGKGTRVAYTLPGWRGSRGGLWRTNTLTLVRDAWLGIEAELLVCGVVFSLTPEEGSLAEVEVTLPDAYDVQVVPLKSAGGRAGAASPGAPIWREETAPGSGQMRPTRPADIPRAP